MITIKIQHENVVNRVPVSVLPSVTVLKSLAHAMFGFKNDFELRYLDEKGELTTILAEEDLLRALGCSEVVEDSESILLYAVESEESEEVEEPAFNPQDIADGVEERITEIKNLVDAYAKEKEVKVKFEAFIDSCEKNFESLSETTRAHYEDVKEKFAAKHSFNVEEHINKLRAEVTILGQVLTEHMSKVPELTGRLAPVIVEHTNRAMELLKEHTQNFEATAASATESAVAQLNSAVETAQPMIQPAVDRTQVFVSDFASVIRTTVEPAINRLYMVASNEIEKVQQATVEPEVSEQDDGITDLLILEQMGFIDTARNEALLKEHQDLGDVVAILVGDM